jgi:DNA (cytosine-5)-methyltransferase 1
MSVSYNNLWKLLVDKNMNKTELKRCTGMGSTTLSKLSKNQVVSMEVIIKICDALQCDVGDIMTVSRTKGGE